MSDRISIGHLYPNAIPPKIQNKVSNPNSSKGVASQPSFQQVLDEKFVRFSHHAEQRLNQRGIKIKPEQMAKLDSAIDKAAAKGAKDSLILMQDMALIVNIKNRIVVTAMDGASIKDNVFTQIDSALIVP